jgi:hypothetical protein
VNLRGRLEQLERAEDGTAAAVTCEAWRRHEDQPGVWVNVQTGEHCTDAALHADGAQVVTLVFDRASLDTWLEDDER